MSKKGISKNCGDPIGDDNNSNEFCSNQCGIEYQLEHDSSPDFYFKHDKHDIFMMFEEEMGKTFLTKLGMICWYQEEWLNRLSLASLIKILITH